MIRWEYKIQRVGSWLKNEGAERELNEAGKDGWELVSVIEFTDTGPKLFFKRQVALDTTRSTS